VAFRLACRYRRWGLPEAEVAEIVLAFAARCRPPLPEAEALAKVANAYARYTPQTGGATTSTGDLPAGVRPVRGLGVVAAAPANAGGGY
jgi:hypothetical protein